ncbi:MAG TPA: hypothetical protein VMW16_06280 [Sedimentisphaerales bacterium]|nr:hypothetical protein [Sedimentisphaerales bacterium]
MIDKNSDINEYASDEGTAAPDLPMADMDEDMKESAKYYPISKPKRIIIRASIIHDQR